MANQATILAIEDESDLRKLLRVVLGRAGFKVLDTGTGRAGLRMLHERRPDLVLLDIGLPELDGWQVIERIRDVSDVPVIMLTAHDLERDKVHGLQAGADDYLTKPFGHTELVARIQAVLRRSATSRAPSRCFADGVLTVDFGARTAHVEGVPIDVTPTEFRLLVALVRHAGQVVSPEQLLELAWNDPTQTGPERVKFAVLRLRRKLGWSDPSTSPIEAVRGFGYRYRSS
jgi:DNA-binding response OmpR family regulator